ncbi:MAG TPA: mechanosensitive ion channel family protein [Patescibacteria group bacterium]|jgi:small-conductance mechanosensitive channel|nr:mechanosensitive ion channel family protein [Patescibacteria group bacterium]
MLTKWISTNGLPIILLIISAFLTDRFGLVIIKTAIKRAVGRLQNDISPSDIRKRQETLIGILGAFFRVLVWLVAGFSILGRFGVNLTPLLAGASVLGVAIGFGAQSIVKDFLAGLFIILENQFRVGDVVELDGASGTVEQITLRSTIMRDVDGNVHHLPNGSISRTINKTMGFSKVNLVVSVAPDTNIDTLAGIVNEVGEKIYNDDKWKAKILEAPHFLSIANFSNTALDIKIVGKTQPSEQWSVTSELRKRLIIAFKKKDIDIAPTSPGTSANKK